jgi:hypothetical protein
MRTASVAFLAFVVLGAGLAQAVPPRAMSGGTPQDNAIDQSASLPAATVIQQFKHAAKSTADALAAPSETFGIPSPGRKPRGGLFVLLRGSTLTSHLLYTRTTSSYL